MQQQQPLSSFGCDVTAMLHRQLSTCARYCQAAGATLHLLPAYLVLSVCYCLWFVFMRFFNDL